MNISTRLAARIFDTAVIAAMVWGDENMQTFGFVVGAMFTVTVWTFMFALTRESAKEIHGTLIRRIIGISIGCGYTYGLLACEHPIWAAFYITGFMLLHANAARIATKKEYA